KKWRKEHVSLFVVLGALQVAAFVLPFVIRTPWAVGFAPLIGIAEYCYQNNKMMIYVENQLYDR
ncbi:MAG: transcriptional regulator, partial [Faecalibacterium sp.]